MNKVAEYHKVETDDAIKLRLAKEAERRRLMRAAETPEQKQERNKREAERKRKQRQEQAEHLKLEQAEFDDIQKQLQAVGKVPTSNEKETQSKELQIAYLNQRSLILKTKLDTRLERLKKQADAKRLQRNNESEEKKKIRRRREAEYQRLRRASYSDEKKVVMKWREAERKRKLRHRREHDLPLNTTASTISEFHMSFHPSNYLNVSAEESRQNIAKLREQFKPCNEIEDVFCHDLIPNKAITNICGNIKNNSKTNSLPRSIAQPLQHIDADRQNIESSVYKISKLCCGNDSVQNNEIMDQIEHTIICKTEPNDSYDESAYFETVSNDSSLIPENNDIVNVSFDSFIANGSSFEEGLNLFEDYKSDCDQNE